MFQWEHHRELCAAGSSVSPTFGVPALIHESSYTKAAKFAFRFLLTTACYPLSAVGNHIFTPQLPGGTAVGSSGD